MALLILLILRGESRNFSSTYRERLLSVKIIQSTLITFSSLTSLLMLAACSIEDSDSTVRAVPVNFSGFYSNNNNAITTQNSGNTVTSLDLIQNGDGLEGIDNNGHVFRGTLGQVASDNSATFTLEGRTTANQSVIINGTLSGEGTSATMRGSWIEPSLFGAVFATATINPIDDGDNNETNTTAFAVSPSGPVSLATGASQTFTASGGSGSFTWSVSSSALGTLSATSGASVRYTAINDGTQTVSATDGTDTINVTVTQQ